MPPIEKQLEEIISKYETVRAASQTRDGEDIPTNTIIELRTRCLAAIRRVSGNHSIYDEMLQGIASGVNFDYLRLESQISVARALLDDIKDGYLYTVAELIHGEVFGDFLEMAKHLLDNGYKDAAAVIAGSTLEAHLRQLCAKSQLPTMNGAAPKKADTLNADLMKANAYGKLDQKNVTAWLDLRNKAAHGQYSDYDKGQVELLISGIRDFITRVPA